MHCRHWIGVGATTVVGLVFLAAGVGKLLYGTEVLKIFFIPFPDFFTPGLVKAFFVWLPRAELMIGLLLVIGIAAKLVATFSSVLVSGFIANNIWLLTHGLGHLPCGCFGMPGGIAEAKLSIQGALYLDIAMLTLIAMSLCFYQDSFFSIYPWFLVRRKIPKAEN